MAVIESGLASNLAHDMAAVFGRIYRVNGWDRMSVWDGYLPSAGAAVPAGLASPISAVAFSAAGSSLVTGGVTEVFLDIGVHLLRYRYANSKTQYVSNPSPIATINALARAAATDGTGAIYTFSNVVKSGDPKADRIVVEMTDAGGGTFFQATVLANSGWHSVALQTRDKDLRARPLFWDEFGHDTPPFFSIIEPFRGRTWGMGQIVYDVGQAQAAGNTVAVSGSGTSWTSAAKGRLIELSGLRQRFIASVVDGTYLLLESAAGSASSRNYQIVSETPDTLFWSKALFTESFPPENVARVLDGKPEKGRALKGWRRDMIVFGERAMERVVYQENPFADGQIEPIDGERGAASRRCVQDVNEALYALDYKGIHRWAGGSPQHISEAIDPWFDPGDRSLGYVDLQYRSQFHSVHFPARHQILWFVVMADLPGETNKNKPHHALVYDYGNNTFTLARFDVAITSSTMSPGTDGSMQTLLADENGRLWVYGIGNTDGVHSDSATSFTVRSGTTATNILASAATLYASGDRLNGSFAYWVEGTQGQLLQSNSASALVLDSPFSAVPSVGDTITLGRIPSKWKSKAFFFTSPTHRHLDGRYLHLFYEPESGGEIRVRFYLDRSATAYDDYDEDSSIGGVAQDADNNYFTVDLTITSGYARIPLPSDGSHTIEFEIEIVDSATSFKMTGFEIDSFSYEEDSSP